MNEVCAARIFVKFPGLLSITVSKRFFFKF